MQSEIIDINKIKKNPDNPRLIKDSQYQTLIRSIKEFPEMLKLRPLVLDESNIILGGNMRYEACRELGIKEIPVIYAKGLTDKQKKEFIIKDKNNSIVGPIGTFAGQRKSVTFPLNSRSVPLINEIIAR